MASTGSAYLVDLTLRLAGGVLELTPERRQGHQQAVMSFFRAEQGGFAGREGEADIYYTSFALRALLMMDGLDDQSGQRVDAYLRKMNPTQLPLIDSLCWVFSLTSLQMMGQVSEWMADWSAEGEAGRGLLSFLESYRREDGGYAKSSEGAASSTYHSFLVVLARELIGEPPPEPDRLVNFVRTMKRDDGGFVEIRPMKRGGTNPTAAAVGLLRILDGLTDHDRASVQDFLEQMAGPVGGFRANGRAPACDVLSTFTALVTLIDLGLAEQIDATSQERFLQNAEFGQGGFSAGPLDRQCDAEYIFYGLGGLGLLRTLGTPRL